MTFGHNGVICLILPCCEVIFMGQLSKPIRLQVEPRLCQRRAWSWVPLQAMTRHLPNWARIYRLGSEQIFGVCVVTFDTWHLAILFDWVQGIMLVSQGKVLSPGNEGSMAVIV